MKPLTAYLAPMFAENPLRVVDIGARWGMDKRWEDLGDSLRAFCFEADAPECDRLNKEAHSGVRYIPSVIAGGRGKRNLYKTRFAESSGLHRVNDIFFNRLLNAENAFVVDTQEVDTIGFEQARETYGIDRPDFIKLDVEGAELEILQGINLGATFGIFTEIRFHREINGCAPFSEVDQFLCNRRFMLYDLTTSRQSRKALPYQGPRLTTADGMRFFGPTDNGQVMDGNALYFRDPMMLSLNKVQILKIACMFELFDLNDCAAELLIAREKEAEVDLMACLNLLAGGDFRKYMESY